MKTLKNKDERKNNPTVEDARPVEQKLWLVSYATTNAGLGHERTLTSLGIARAPDIQTAEREALLLHVEEGFSDEPPFKPRDSEDGEWGSYDGYRAFKLSDEYPVVDAGTIFWIEWIREVNAADGKVLEKYLDHLPGEVEMEEQRAARTARRS